MTERSWSKIRIWLLLQIVKLTDLCPDHLSLQTQEQSLHDQRATNITSGTLSFHLKFLPAFVNINLLVLTLIRVTVIMKGGMPLQIYHHLSIHRE